MIRMQFLRDLNKMINRILGKLLLLPLCVWFMLCCMSGCAQEAESFRGGDESETAVIRLDVRSDTPNNLSTRAMNEDAIHDLHILVYNSLGELTGKSYKIGAPYTVTARSGTNCKIYAIANTGNADLFNGTVVATEQKLKDLTANISSWNEITNSSYLLMAGSRLNMNIVAGESTLTDGMTVKRLAAKVTLDVGISAGSGVTISGYRIYGISQKSYYVPRPLGTEGVETDTQTSRAEDASLPANAANWTNSGLAVLSNVSSFNTTFYMYENRPGISSTITAQKNRIKANVPGTPADSAAYVIIYGKATGYSSLSWKIYLGANNTTNFNIKRNCKYTYTITLKPNESDMRITFKGNGGIWAGSNIYWDGTKLTFDTETTNANNKKQGVCFKWGSLVGMSLSNTYVTYTPTYNSAIPAKSTWAVGSTTYTSINPITDNVTDGSQTNTYLNDAAQNTNTNYAAYKGDICKYLSKTGAVTGSWRMPTAKEFNATNLADNVADTSWSTATTPWAYFGSFDDQMSSVNAQGTFLLSSGATYTVNGSSSKFSAMGWREYWDPTIGTGAYGVGQAGHYWSSSAYTGSTMGYFLNFGISFVRPARIDSREYGFAVRCVQN